MATLTSKLVVELLDRATGPAGKISATINRLTAASKANAARLDEMRGRMLGAVGAGYALYKGLSAPIRAAVEFESAMADIRKVVNFDTSEAFRRMGLEIREMSKRMPMAAKGIAEIVAAAGQSGIANTDLLKFAEIATKVGVAWDTTAKETGQALAELKAGLGLSLDDTASLADAINHLGNNSAASAPRILDVVQRVASSAKQFGLSAEQTAAFGAAMVGAGFDSNVAATSILNMGRALVKGASATKRQVKAFKTLGLTPIQVAKAMQKDAPKTIQAVLARINKVPAHMRGSIISNLFGDEARALGPLIGNQKLLAETLALVGDKAKYAGSAQKEYDERSKTTGNNIQLFQNRVHDLSISIGEALAPGLNRLLDTLGPNVSMLSDVAKQFPQITSGVVSVAAGLIGLQVASTAARFAFLWFKGGVIGAAIKGLTAVGRVTLTAGKAFKALRAATVGATMLGAVGGGGLLSGVVGGAGTAVAAILGLAGSLAAGIAAITAPVWGIIAAIGIAVGGLALAVYKYWVPISNFVAGFASVIFEAISSVASEIAAFGGRIASAVGSWATQKLIDFGEWLGIDEATMRQALDFAVSMLSQSAQSIIDTIKAIPATVGGWIADIFTMNTYSAEATAGFRTAGENAGRAFVEAIKSTFNALIDWFKALPGRILGWIGKIDLSKIVRLPSLPSWLSGGSPAVAGARAAGGPVSRGKTYLVGERGPELFRAPASGSIANTMDTVRAIKAQALAGAAGHKVTNVGGITLHVHAAPGQSPEDVARAVHRVLSDQLNALSRGAHSDGAY